MESKSERDMRLKDSVFLAKMLFVLKRVYWTWLFVCFFNSFRLAQSIALNYRETSKLIANLVVI